MKEEKIILSCVETEDGKMAGAKHTCREFPSAPFVKSAIAADMAAYAAGIPATEPVVEVEQLEGDLNDLFLSKNKEGTLAFKFGKRVFYYAFKKIPGEYHVSDDEMVQVIEAFCNTSRCRTEYEKAAALITTKMHRYVQGEFWRFVKCIIRAFSTARSDERNKRAVNEAAEIATYMENNDIN